MTRLLFTALLLISVLGSVAALMVQSGKGQLARLFLSPAVESGAKLISIPASADITTIEISTNREKISLKKTRNEWWLESPYEARADYRIVKSLILLARNSVIKKQLPQGAEHLTGATNIRLIDASGGHYELNIGRTLPLYHRDSELYETYEVTLPDSLYSYCAYCPDLKSRPTFTIDALVDKRPFFFHPDTLQSIEFESANAKITLERKSNSSPWKITRPIPLRTNPKAVATLIQNLYSLEAEEVVRGSVSPLDLVNEASTLTLNYFDEVQRSQSLSFPNTLPNTAYQKEESTDQGLTFTFRTGERDNVRLGIDALRSRTLSSIDLSAIDFILLQSKSQTSPVTLTIKSLPSGQRRWMYEYQGTWNFASEHAVAKLVDALTKDEVISFSTIQLQQNKEPDKSISIYSKSGETIHFDLATIENKPHIQRRGTPNATIISSSTASKLKTSPYDWKDTLLWQLSPIHLKGIMRQTAGKPTELYSYDYTFEEWNAQIGSKRVNDLIDPVSSNRFLNSIEQLYVERWIAETDPLVTNATQPLFTFVAQSQVLDTNGISKGLETITLELYPLSQSSLFYLGAFTKENQPTQYCIIHRETARSLNQRLIYED